MKWAEAGFDPEFSTIDKLETAAKNYQRAFKIKESQSRGGREGKDGRKNQEKSGRNPEGDSSKKHGKDDKHARKDKGSRGSNKNTDGSGKQSG